MSRSGRVRRTVPSLALAVWLALAGTGQASDEDGDLVRGTRLFSFHSNAWINQHHFLYNLAKDRVDAGELASLDAEGRRTLEAAADHYREEVIEHDLLFSSEMFNLKRWLIEQDPNRPLPPSERLAVTVEWLNRSNDVYREHLWPRHDARNRETLARNLSDLEATEERAAQRLAELAQTSWPAEPIRTDITYYSNWAGAYTSTRPVPHVVVRSLDEGPRGDWLETIYHEPTHALVGGRRGAVAEAIAAVSEELGIEVPRNLWHGFLFYFAGRVTEDLIEPITGEDYVQFMERGDVFGEYYPHLVAHAEPYVRGEIDLGSAVRRTVESWVAEHGD